MISFDLSTIRSWDRFYRANFINCLSGYKSAHLIGTISKDGIPNLALFSNIVHLGADPALIGFINRPKAAAPDTIRNIEETGVFTMNHIHPAMIKQAHQTSAKYDSRINEFEAVGFSEFYKQNCIAPFVAESRVQYQLSLADIIPIPRNGTFLVTGLLEQVHLAEDYIQADGNIPLEKYETITSLGLENYYSTSFIEKLSHAKTEKGS